jgi:hypothetical protein
MIILSTSGDYAADLRAQQERRRIEAEEVRQRALSRARWSSSSPCRRIRSMPC